MPWVEYDEEGKLKIDGDGPNAHYVDTQKLLRMAGFAVWSSMRGMETSVLAYQGRYRRDQLL